MLLAISLLAISEWQLFLDHFFSALYDKTNKTKHLWQACWKFALTFSRVTVEEHQLLIESAS